jgi:hypothetical protein
MPALNSLFVVPSIAALKCPHNIPRDAKMGAILTRFRPSSISFLFSGRDSGQRLKTENLGSAREVRTELGCPKTRAASGVCGVPNPSFGVLGEFVSTDQT